MLFTGGTAGVLSTKDRTPPARTAWMVAAPAPTLNPSGAVWLAPGIWIVKHRTAWPVSMLDTARLMPDDDWSDVEPIKRNFRYPAWHTRAICVGVLDADKLFFGIDDEGHPPLPPRYFRAARAICDACPVRRECLTQALGQPESHGVWAGTTGRQRVPLRFRIKAGESVESVVEQWLSR